METINNVHIQFAGFFGSAPLRPYAYLLSKKLAEGHICVPLDEIGPSFDDDPFFAGTTEVAARAVLNDEPLVTTLGKSVQPFVLHNDKLYLQRYFHYESLILERILQFISSEAGQLNERLEALDAHRADILALPGFVSVPAAGQLPWQSAAVISGALNNFTIITGGPGTGKTTTVSRLLSVLFLLNPALKVGLAAPTGKAAARMAESLKASARASGSNNELFATLQPATIHRLLRNVPGTTRFRYNRSNPLPHDIVIVDESSMIDVALFAKLLDAIGPHTRLIMLGDKDQLASVEAGSLFGDLCQAADSINRFSNTRAGFINSFAPSSAHHFTSTDIRGPVPMLSGHIIELQYSHRFSADKGIGRLSQAVIQNDTTIINQFLDGSTNDPEVIIDEQDSREVFESFILGYQEYISEKDVLAALRKLNRLRVLCAVREGDQGLYTMNRHIEEFLRRKGLIRQAGDFYENRPIMVTRNNYRLGLFNGDTGILRYDEKGVLRAWFENAEGTLVSVLPLYLTQIETVFAMTIHKSQGSEFDSVMIVLPAHHQAGLLTRELLYTAITRAKTKVVIRATREIILQTAEQQVNRGSGISDRLKQLSTLKD